MYRTILPLSKISFAFNISLSLFPFVHVINVTSLIFSSFVASIVELTDLDDKTIKYFEYDKVQGYCVTPKKNVRFQDPLHH